MAIILKKKGRGRPKGAKTNPQSPRMVAAALRRQRIEAEKLSRSQNQPAPPPTENLQPEIKAVNDTAIFGQTTLPPENKPVFETELPETDLNYETEKITIDGIGKTESENSESSSAGEKSGSDKESEKTFETSTDPEAQRGLSTIIWDSLVGFFASFVGSFWYPRKVGRNAENNEIPYDERELVISAFCRYFDSIGLKSLTPLQELFATIGTYILPRLRATFDVLRFKFMKKAKTPPPQPANDPRMASTPPPNPPDEKPASPPPTNSGFDAVAESIAGEQRKAV